MDGRSVLKWAVRLLVDTVQDVVKSADLSLEDVKLVILHQANFRILDAAATSLGLRPEQVFMNLERYGNTSAGSIPLALDEAFRGGRIAPGDRVLLCGFGAGLAWGAAVIEW
jgi:3-oxoacyl-[acyl-carrier-protein] synthase-3